MDTHTRAQVGNRYLQVARARQATDPVSHPIYFLIILFYFYFGNPSRNVSVYISSFTDEPRYHSLNKATMSSLFYRRNSYSCSLRTRGGAICTATSCYGADHRGLLCCSVWAAVGRWPAGQQHTAGKYM
jgi:hypothetical protein